MSMPVGTPFSSWPRGRRIAAVLSIAAGLAVACCAALYLSAVVFLLMHKANPAQARFTSIVDYWHLYSEDVRLRKQLVGSLAASGFVFLVFVPAALATSLRRRRPLHGDARFANHSEVLRSGLAGRRGPSDEPGIIVGRYRGRYLALGGQLSVMLSAPTRSGKGVGIVVPNLLAWPDSVVVLDIKGENFELSAGFRAAHGQPVYAFSPFNEDARTHRWNALASVRTDPIYRVSDLLAIGQVFYPNDGGGSLEAFFNDQARNLFLAIGLYLLETPELPRSIGEMLRQSSGKGRSLKEHFTAAMADRAAAGRPLSAECVDALQRVLTTSENTLSSIVATFNAPLTIFADAIVDAATSDSEFDLADVRRRRMSIYVRVPPNKLANARPLLNVFFSQLVNLNTRDLPEHDSTLRFQCLLVNDEFPAMGRVGAISAAAAFLPGYNLRLLTVVQAMSQLDSLYGDKDARTFATNHGLQILYAPREQRDAEEYSAMLGHFTERATSRGRSRSFSRHSSSTVSESQSEQRRSLLLPQEFKELGSERLVLILENSKPILADKIRYHREQAFTSRLRPPPVVPRLDIDMHLARVQQRVRDLQDSDLGPDERVDLSKVAHRFSELPSLTERSGPADVQAFVSEFFSRLPHAVGEAPEPTDEPGGCIEPVAEEGTADAVDLAALEMES
jgi:type IV secretion system protein VirD4